eukprot:Polyplicarium_translucidae@DN3217_c0_g1_i1.p1
MVDVHAPYEDVFAALRSGFDIGSVITRPCGRDEATLDGYRLQILFEDFDWDNLVKVHDSWRQLKQTNNLLFECEQRVWELPHLDGNGPPAKLFLMSLLTPWNRGRRGAWLLLHPDGRFMCLSGLRAAEAMTKSWRISTHTFRLCGDECVIAGKLTPAIMARRISQIAHHVRM